MTFRSGDDDQSSRWEDEYLKDDQIARALALKAVTLRINAQSAEAGFLAAYYPLPVVPAFILIQYVNLRWTLLIDNGWKLISSKEWPARS